MASTAPTMDDQSSVSSSKSSGFRIQPGRLVLYAILFFGAFLAFLPFFWMLSTSLMTLGETINRQWLPDVPQFSNYVEAWEEARFDKYFLNSVIITLVTLAGLLTSSVLAAYAFARIDFWGKNVLFAILLATMMIPESVTMIPNFLMIRGDVIPLPGGTWLNRLPALTVPFMANAFSIFLLRQFFAQIPNELWDSAQIDGAGHFRFLLRIVLPMSVAPILTVTIFAFIGAWNAFLWPLLVTTKPDWRPLMVGLWTFVTEAGPETQLLMAGAVITVIPILIMYFLTQKQFTEGIATSGLKG
ncbi:MAG: carbohydrate ABC transporter permease [Chloroflexota bacterium]|nr:carbohydrate ABC transporter permease [Chloroflexota bacterium]